jgi:hypothetical protein
MGKFRFGYLSGTTAIVLIGASLLSGAGCSDGRPDRVRVSGRVLIDGKPLTFGDVKFVPEGARPSSGKLDENGRFTLTCYDGDDGAVPGIHRVQVAANEISQGQKVQWHAPIKYANFRTSGISFELTESTDSLEIQLTSDGAPAKIHVNTDAS